MELSDKPMTLVCSFKNEETAGPAFISDLLGFLKAGKYDYNLILIDDGSTDLTTKSLLPLTGSNVSLITLDRNIGKVAAQAVGAIKFHKLGSDLIFFDGDGQHRASEILKVIDSGRNNSRITVGERSQQYQRKFKSKAGIALLRVIFKILGIKISLQSSELIFIPSHDATKILANSDFGFLPINNLLEGQKVNLIPIEIYSRLDELPNKGSRHESMDLIRKGLIQVYSQPIRMLKRVVIMGSIPVTSIYLYGIYIGLRSIQEGDPTGVGSIVVIISFTTVVILILGLISFGFLIVINEWIRTRVEMARELK
jgi:hypothetical protein